MVHGHLKEIFILRARTLMVDQAGPLQKLLPAVRAVEGFHADMNPFVGIDIRFLSKCFPTEATDERFFAARFLFMLFEVRPLVVVEQLWT